MAKTVNNVFSGLGLAFILLFGNHSMAYSESMNNTKILVCVQSQQLSLLAPDGKIIKSYKISTSRFGTGTEAGSNKTPLGKFRIAEKIGDGAQVGEIFKSRIPTGEFGKDGDPADYVETRILWLEGLEPANANTHERFIYIHGTNSEKALGSPVSFGCVRLSNVDVIDLYDRVNVGTAVEIKQD